ncbi:MAG: flavodoxin [Eubacterium sp.]
MTNTLVIYYSRTGENYVNGDIKKLKKGNTEIVAEFIRDAVGADLFQVETVKTYAADYYACIDDAKEELKNQDRPELKTYLDDISAYDNIVVAGPCWWGTYPMAIFSQLERLDFTGKKVFPVMTHEGSGLAGSAQALKKMCSGAEVGSGLAVHGADATQSKAKVSKWAEENLK